jgi:lipid II:glycine glycyltransferase (peptidoglycan interpeptide bridge formation enzyme)
LRDVKIDGESSKVEYRIEVKDNSNIIMRVESENNVVVTAILFAKTEFLGGVKNYYEGDIYVNSDEERKFFMTYK